MRRLAFLIVVILLAQPAAAWWSAEWTQRKQISVNTTGTGANTREPLNEAPVLVRLHGGNFPQFLNVRDGGADFRFVAGDDQTPLKYHVERFDPVAQIAMVWVKLPTLNPQGTDDKFYLYFANQAAVKGDDPGATYDPDTGAVFHFNQSAGMPLDSTAYATQITTGEVFPNPASIVGHGASLAGTSALVVGDAPHLALDPAKGTTVQLWLRIDSESEEPVYIMDRESDGARSSLVLNGTALSATFNEAEVASAAPVQVGAWHHIAVRLAPDSLALFVDGQEAGSVETTLVAMSGPIYIGGDVVGGGLLSASIDELRIDMRARSPEEIAFNAAIQGERNDAVLVYSADEGSDQAGAAGGEGHTSHFGIIIQNVFGKKEAIVEQLVIGMCGVMMAIAILVMFMKAVFLSRSRRSTNKFLAAYEAMGTSSDGGDIDGLVEGEETFGDSPLFNVYRQGITEVRSRLSPAVGADAAGLEGKSLEAIRATLDAVMVREGQKLNGMLVLLTIAISGGPFIGLLGTVVGVMVTFAAIAATGDVNITAIAPGMAAALLATVAGLGVAIPALFGYNYLSAKAKDINADMHVFADEFVARINERYGI